MRNYQDEKRLGLTVTILCLILGALSGCAVVGPSSISQGRGDYNEAINRTEDEQLLMSIVRGRYGDTFTLLTVTGVAANVRFGARAGVQAGFGQTENYVGNLVPFGGDLAYEENPTITYAPVQGEQHMQQMMVPIPLNILLLVVRGFTYEGDLFTLMVNRINDLRNPDFLTGKSAELSIRFKRFVELAEELRDEGVLDWISDPRDEVAFDVVISNYAPQYSQQVREFLTLLDLPIPAEETEDIVIPAYFAVKTRKMWGIGITTRSTMDVVEILRAAVEVPQEHARAGLAVMYPPVGLPGQGIRIIASKEKPKNLSLAVTHRGYWFYIDEADQCTKAVFRVLRALWSFSISRAVGQRDAPVLTIPVN